MTWKGWGTKIGADLREFKALDRVLREEAQPAMDWVVRRRHGGLLLSLKEAEDCCLPTVLVELTPSIRV